MVIFLKKRSKQPDPLDRSHFSSVCSCNAEVNDRGIKITLLLSGLSGEMSHVLWASLTPSLPKIKKIKSNSETDWWQAGLSQRDSCDSQSVPALPDKLLIRQSIFFNLARGAHFLGNLVSTDSWKDGLTFSKVLKQRSHVHWDTVWDFNQVTLIQSKISFKKVLAAEVMVTHVQV